MVVVLFVLCCLVGLGLYFGIVRPLLVPLRWRIPTDPAYRPRYYNG